MKILKVFKESPNEKLIEIAANAIKSGKIVIYPTDTLYALGCDALNNNAIEKICKIKGLKSDKTNLSIICKDISQVAEYAKFNNAQFRMMKDNLPGAFTFIFPSMSKLPKAFKGRRTVGVRIPDNPISMALAQAVGHPIMTTSIKHDDSDYMCEPELIAERYLNDVELIIDGGRGDTLPSTIIDCTESEPRILREGKGLLNT